MTIAFARAYRLVPRGAAGLACDDDGVALGPMRLVETVTDASGNPESNVTITWSIVPPRAATVDGTGLVTAVAPGNCTLSAQVGPQLATAAVLIQGATAGPVSRRYCNRALRTNRAGKSASGNWPNTRPW